MMLKRLNILSIAALLAAILVLPTYALPIRFDCNGALFQGELKQPEQGVVTLHSVIEGAKAYSLKLAPDQDPKKEFLSYLLESDGVKARAKTKKYLSLPRNLFDGKAVENFHAFYNNQSLSCEAQGTAQPEKTSSDELMKVISVEFRDQFNSNFLEQSPWKNYVKAGLLPPKHEQVATQLANEASNELNSFSENNSFIVVREGKIMGYIVAFRSSNDPGGALYLDFKGNVVANHIGR